jgi:hypothetical protein
MKNKHYNLKITTLTGLVRLANSKEKISIDCFDLKNDGYHFGRIESWRPSEKELDTLNITTSNKSIDLQNKKIYRYPNLELPRQKVALLKTKFNVKVSRDSDSADIHVISDKIILNLVSIDWDKSVTYPELFNIFNLLKLSNQLTECGLDKCKEYLSIIEKDAYIKIDVLKDYRSPSSVGNYITDTLSDIERDGNRDMLIKGENAAIYDQLVNTTALIIKDVEINKIISKDLAIITEDEFDQVSKMITSSDKDNRTLATEMLANCNVEESFDIVSFLFFWYFDWFKDTNNWNNINVKTLRKRLEKFSGSKDTNRQWAYDEYIKLLHDENKVTDFIVEKTIKKLYDSVIKNTFGCTSNVFSIDIESIYLVDKFKNSIIKKENV